MKKMYLLTFALLLAAFVSNAQVYWDYEEDSTSIIGVVDMSDAYVYYEGSSCSNCSWNLYMNELFADGGPYKNAESFTNFNVYGETVNYMYFTSNGILTFNDYYSSSNSGNNLSSHTSTLLQWGGNSSGYVEDVRAKIWEIPDGPRVMTIQASFTLDASPSDQEYGADVQIHLIEYIDVIELNYFNFTGTEGSSSYCGITSGDGTHYTYIDSLGYFPTVDANFILTPGLESEMEMLSLDFDGELFSCDLQAQTATVGILNKGTVPQSEFDVNLYVNDELFATETVTEPLEQFDYLEIEFPQTIAPSQDGQMINVVAEIDFTDSVDDNSKTALLVDFITAEPLPASACYGDNAVLEATGGVKYLWAEASNPEEILYVGEGPFVVEENLYEPREYLVNAMGSDIFIMASANTFTYVDHDYVSGDDRGGIAVTQEYLYIVGDDATVRMDANSLNGQVALPIRDGLFSDLLDGKLYSLYNTDIEEMLDDDAGNLPFTVNAIIELDTDLQATENVIALDQAFVVDDSNYEGGIFAGLGMVMVKDGEDNDLYKIDIATGMVDSLGVYDNLEDDWNTENWAMWGFIEYVDDEPISIIMPSYDDYYGMKRIFLSTGDEAVAVDFEEEPGGYYPDDLHSITYSPWTSRVYYHSETYDEDGGYFEVVAGLTGDCWSSVTVEIVDEAWAGIDAEVNVCNDASVDLLTLIPGEPNAGGDWTDVDATGALTDGTLDATQLDEGTFEFVYTVNPEAPCVDNAQVTLTVNVNEAANAGSGTDAEVCNTAVYYNLSESLDGTQDMYGYWSDDDATGVLNGSIVELETLALGDYTFTYHAFGFGACEEDVESITVTVEDCSGIEDVNAEFKVYPNPSSGTIYINIPNQQADEINLRVTDVQGRIVYENILTSNRVDLTNLPEGMYYMEIVNVDLHSIRKIVIE